MPKRNKKDNPLIHPRLPRLKRGVAAAGIAAGSLLTTPALASEALSFGGGVYLNYTFGEAGSGVGWGVEGFSHYFLRTSGCPSDYTLPYVGGSLKIGAIGLERPRVVASFQGGTTIAEILSGIEGELGLTLRMGEMQGVGVHLGASANFLLLRGSYQAELGLDEYSVGGGLGIATGMHVPFCTVVGRPLRDEEGEMAGLPELTMAKMSDHTHLVGTVSADIVEAWNRRTQTEWASVPTFLQLAIQLQHVGAPPNLVRRSLQAAEDEYRHAILSGGIASSFSGDVLGLGEPLTVSRPPQVGKEALCQLATESWIDGCLGEGAAAAIAGYEAEHATESSVKQTQEQIAEDEAQHAELAWDVLAWTFEKGGSDIKELTRSIRNQIPEGFSDSTYKSGSLKAGCASSRQATLLTSQSIDKAQVRLDKMLAAA